MGDKKIKIIAQPEYAFDVHDFDPSRDGNLNKKIIDETWVENVYRIQKEDFWGDNPSFVDLGANIGAVSIWVDRFNNDRDDKIKIISVEPEPTNVKLLIDNLSNNPSYSETLVIPLAVWHENATFKISPQGANANIMDGVGADVKTITIEQIMDENGLEDISVIKIDIEGAEIDLLLNTPEETMQKLRYITMEIDATNKERFGLLVSKLTETHKIEILGHYDKGTYLWGRRY